MGLGQFFVNLRLFSARFFFISVVPTVTLVAFILLLALSGAPQRAPYLPLGLKRLEQLSDRDLVLLFIAALVVGMILHPMQFSMIQFLEGYWGASWLAVQAAHLATHRYDRRRQSWDLGQQLDAKSATVKQKREQAIYAQAFASLPRQDRMLPTRLGNVLRAAEDASGERYGLRTVLITPLLVPQLPPPIADRLAGSRLQLDTSVRFCLIWLIATAASFGMLVRFGNWLYVPVATYLLAWLSYRAACAAAGGYGLMLRVAVDLHRFDLMNALHVALPSSYGEERSRNEQLMSIISGSAQRTTAERRQALNDFTYSHNITNAGDQNTP